MTDKLDLNSLQLFYDVVNAQSITRAALELGMPKSTISRKLTQLEQNVGTILLKKGQRRLTTTEIGARVALIDAHTCLKRGRSQSSLSETNGNALSAHPHPRP